jgi:nitrate/nitrite transport system ATP-binding protein
VTLDRPRDRKALNHDPEFKRLRAQVTTQLLVLGAARKTTGARRLVLPDVLPEDLELPRTNRYPRRSHAGKPDEPSLRQT